ncbi:class I SAM-dependent methyltransferase [Acidisoma cladoniae]|uniref:class I SAM-dependent methyltransferase n=1 Tax=Acidisoma cladoniae TaxID=3040935 RepID=UPI002550F05D|nr:class I SAM-dependent methyltransferase [Acidisoma sp. PAMC 29798]
MNDIFACKVCGGDSHFFTSVDSLQNCNKQIVPPIAPSGVSVDYYRCSGCGFVFTHYIDALTDQELLISIYNHDYVKFDPLYTRIRPEANASLLKSVINEAYTGAPSPRILDYGAGNGVLSDVLRDDIRVENYDALNPMFDRLPQGGFDIVFCAEVVEHVPTPHSLLSDWKTLLSTSGCVIFSTTILPSDIETLKGDWWYMGPRNGHVSLFSVESLRILCAKHDLHYEYVNDHWHVAANSAAHGVNIDAIRRLVDAMPKGFVIV